MDMKIRKKYVIAEMKTQQKINQDTQEKFQKVLAVLKREEEAYQKREKLKKKPNYEEMIKNLKFLKEIRQQKDDQKEK